MSEHRGEDSPEGSSVFGNLPRSRPGTRSPRRDDPTGARRADSPGARAEPATREERARDEPGRDEPDEAPSTEAETEHRAGLEDLAWAGVAAAAEAATIGVRLASRAMEALRGSDRR